MHAPRLNGLEPWYLKSQITKFKTSLRGAHPEDTYGAPMVPMMALLKDEQAIDDVIAYIQSHRTNRWPMRKAIEFILALSLVWLVRFVFNESNTTPAITLCQTCPPGFELTQDNICKLRTLYQLYETGNNNEPGVGGLKTPVPPLRDGFSPQQIDLGRYLFFDPALSKDGTRSCASCHQPDKGFSDGLKTSIGVNGTPLKRGAPGLWNVAFNKKFFWDARATSLEEQMKGPLYSPDEMGNTPEHASQNPQRN